jgi:putative SOS response-associated peptidase YedK
MCNLYSYTKGQAAIRELARAMHDRTGNLPPMPGIFPDYPAPIVRNGADGRELVMARWGMPSPGNVLMEATRKRVQKLEAKGKIVDFKEMLRAEPDAGVTNVRNTGSSHWRRWLGAESRCLVPFTSFSENEILPDGRRPPVWFALDESRPIAFFAGIQTGWTCVRKMKEGEVTCDIFAFLTTEPNAEVGAIHPKAMPVVLTTEEERETWLTAPTPEALKLQRPLPSGALQIVARGDKKDGAVEPDWTATPSVSSA